MDDAAQLKTARDFVIIVLESHSNDSNHDSSSITNELQTIIDDVRSFTNADESIGFIQNNKDKKIFMIISNNFDQYFFLNLIEELTQVYSFYIICDHQTNYERLKKFKGVFTGIECIFEILKRDVDQCNNDIVSPSIDRFNLKKLDSSYVYSKLLVEVLLKIQYNEDAKKPFIGYWRQQCSDSHARLTMVDEFEKCYKDHAPTWWYAKESFLFSSISRALREVDVDMINKLGFFIHDLHRDIERLYAQAKHKKKMTVYRGQSLSKFDFEKLQKQKGGLMLFNNFLSASPEREISLLFAESAQFDPGMVGVLFEIELDPSISSIPFADISTFHEEQEVLISTHATFLIDDIKTLDNGLQKIKLKSIKDENPQYKYWTDYLRKEIENDNPLISFSLLVNHMGYFDTAKEIYSTLLETTSSAKNYNDIGLVYQSMGNYSMALSYYEKTLEIDQNSLPDDHPALAVTYNNIAGIYRSMGNFTLSLSFYMKALEIKQKTLSSNHPSLATTHNNIGEVYSSIGDYSKALSFYEETLKIQRRLLPFNHQSLATTYNNIGSVQRLLGNKFIAIAFYEKTLEIELSYLLPSHPSLAITYNNIGLLHSLMGNYPNALSCYEKAVEIGQKSLQCDHSSLALFYNNMGEVYDSMQNYSEALALYEKSLGILKKSLPADHPELAAVNNNIGEVYRATGDCLRALVYYQTTLDIEQKTLPETHPSLAITHTNMAVALENIQRINEAIEHVEQAIMITLHTFDSNHPNSKELQEYLNKLREKL